MGKKKGNKTNNNPLQQGNTEGATPSKSLQCDQPTSSAQQQPPRQKRQGQAQPTEPRQGQEQPAQPLQGQRQGEHQKGKAPSSQSERRQDQSGQHQQLKSQGKPGQGKPKQDVATPSPSSSGQFARDQKQQLPRQNRQGQSQPAQPRQGQPERQQQKGIGQSGQSERRQDQPEHHQQQQWQGQQRQEKSKQDAAIPSESHFARTQVRPRPFESGLSISDQKSQPDRQRSQGQTQPAQSRQGQPQREQQRVEGQSGQNERRQDQPGQHQQQKRQGQPWPGKPGPSESRQDQSGRKDQKHEQVHSGQRHPIQDLSAKLSTIDLSRSPSVTSTASSRTEAKSLSDVSHAVSPILQSSALVPVAPYKGCGTNGRKITVDVNFLPLVIEKLLPTVYQYDVTIEPNLPKRLLPKMFEQFRKNNFQNISIAFDGQKIAVAPRIISITDNVQKQTKVLDENGKERVYMVAIKEARDSKIDFSSLKNYTRMRQYDAPLRALQMLEIVLKSPFLDKIGVQAGRSFYMLPNRRFDLGDNFELWTGLYQSTVLGSRPYLNVDIAHKAFPSELSLIDILHNNRANLDNWDRRDEFALLSHLKGLMITYAMPGQEASRRTYKFLRLNNDSKNVKFRNDQDGKEYTIFEYFGSRGVKLRYPYLPTLTVGNAIKNITVPMECCAVAGYQVGCINLTFGRNPVFPGYYADPEGTVYGNKYWIFPTFSAEYENQTFFDAFSSYDMVNWTKHSRILDVNEVSWAYKAMWAPAVLEQSGKYYFFFAANDVHEGEIGGIGVTVADQPEGPYKDLLGRPLINEIVNGAQPIDQFVFQDVDGNTYMYSLVI